MSSPQTTGGGQQAVINGAATGTRTVQNYVGGRWIDSDTKQFGDILVRYRDSLYPETLTIDLAAANRVAQTLIVGGMIKPDASIAGLHDTSIVGS